MNKFTSSIISLLIIVPGICFGSQNITYHVIDERSHKPILFTQGLALENGIFYESSGLYGQSMIVTYPVAEPSSQREKAAQPFIRRVDVPAKFFAEGLTLIDNNLYMLSWREQTLFVLDAKDFTLKNALFFEGQGWGLATNGKVLIRSDGSEKIYFHDKERFSILSDITVTENNHAVKNINELEFIDGFIWANIWHENRIIKIDPKTGIVVGTANLQPLVDDLALIEPESVLNGIAYDSVQDAIWVTGKNWPKMYLLKIK